MLLYSLFIIHALSRKVNAQNAENFYYSTLFKTIVLQIGQVEDFLSFFVVKKAPEGDMPLTLHI
jgi:hypothetical protein